MLNNLLAVPNDILTIVVLAAVAVIALASLVVSVMILKKEWKSDECQPSVSYPQATLNVFDNDNGIPDTIKAAIIAAISAYYFENNNGCEFTVKKIKRIN